MRRALSVLLILVALSPAGCDRKSGPEREPAEEGREAMEREAAPLADLSSSLDAVREAFNARKGEARFLTLLSPT